MLSRVLLSRTLRVNTVRRATTVTTPTLEWENDFKAVSKAESHAIASEYLVKALSSRVYDVAVETKSSFAPTLSNLIKNDVYLKREDTQPVFSFKIRGAGNKIASLTAEQREKGVVTCSAGNHAQGVAMSAHKLGIHATIVMPETAPLIKVDAVKRFGGSHAKVVLHGGNFDEAAAEAKRLVVEQGLTMVHPFDDPLVIAGQATIGMEILKVSTWFFNLSICQMSTNPANLQPTHYFLYFHLLFSCITLPHRCCRARRFTVCLSAVAVVVCWLAWRLISKLSSPR